jgi:hypothetical protein
MLDVGGTVGFWENGRAIFRDMTGVDITIINKEPVDISRRENEKDNVRINYRLGDARFMSEFESGQFDIVFSNSVIEHVGDYSDQRKMANEVMRVGKRYFVQTPYFYFPIEPHFAFPFFQFFPIWFRVWLLCHFSLGWSGRVDDRNKARDLVAEIRLLKRRELADLFPGAMIYDEKFCGITKSLIAYGGWQQNGGPFQRPHEETKDV